MKENTKLYIELLKFIRNTIFTGSYHLQNLSTIYLAKETWRKTEVLIASKTCTEAQDACFIFHSYVKNYTNLPRINNANMTYPATLAAPYNYIHVGGYIIKDTEMATCITIIFFTFRWASTLIHQITSTLQQRVYQPSWVGCIVKMAAIELQLIINL